MFKMPREGSGSVETMAEGSSSVSSGSISISLVFRLSLPRTIRTSSPPCVASPPLLAIFMSVSCKIALRLGRKHEFVGQLRLQRFVFRNSSLSS